MKALFVSNDPSIFVEGSSTRARMRAYATVLGELHIVSAAPGGSVKIIEGALTLHPYRGGKLGLFLFLPSLARHIIRTHGIEVVSAQDPFEHGWAAREAVRGTNAVLHIQVHTDFLSPWFTRGPLRIAFLNRIRQFLAGRVLPHAKGIRVVSARIRNSLLSRFGVRIVEPRILPIEVKSVVPENVPLPKRSFSFTLITLARLESEKHTEDLLDALALVGDVSIGLVIVGEGSERARLTAYAKKLGLEERVLFMGWQEGNVLGLLASADAYIQASAYEGYGRTLIEAALAHLPIITTDVGIVGDVFLGNRDVLIAPVAAPDVLASHIRLLTKDQGLRTELSDSAEKTARAHLATYADGASLQRDDLAHAIATSV